MIRVVIADDSAFMRKVLADLFNKTQGFEVVGQATDGKKAVELVAKLKPDLLTLDVHMPILDGLQALEIIMKDCPVPVLMFSSLTKQGADETLRALELGAVDFMCKTGGSISRIDAIEKDIIEKCRNVAAAQIGRFNFNKNNFAKKQEATNLKRINIFERKKISSTYGTRNVPETKPTTTYSSNNRGDSRNIGSSTNTTNPSLSVHKSVTDLLAKRDNVLLRPRQNNPLVGSRSSGSGHKLVVLGTSTGGPRALQYVIPKLPKNMPCGMVVVQHMPAGFTKSLADRLNTLSQVTVSEAVDHEKILPGHVYIAPGDYHLTVEGTGENREISLNQSPPLASHRPAVDVMFGSVERYGSDIVSVILTGMGCDGAAGMKKIKSAGGYVIAESKETTVVYGMPKSVVDAGIADEVLPVGEIADAIMERVKK